MNILKEDNSNLEYLKIDNQSKKAIFLFHGYGASMQDLYGLGQVIKTKEKYDWIFPNGPLSVPLGMHVEGRAWFPINMQDLEVAMMQGTFRNFADKFPEEFKNVLPIAKTFVEAIAKDYEEIIIGGFSQGSMVTSHITAMNIEKLKGLILYSGTLLGKDHLMDNLESTKPIPFFQSHGKQDPVLNYNEAMALFELLKLSRFQGEFVSFNGAHEIPMEVIVKTGEFLDRL